MLFNSRIEGEKIDRLAHSGSAKIVKQIAYIKFWLDFKYNNS